jgi:hypothetical protein
LRHVYDWILKPDISSNLLRKRLLVGYGFDADLDWIPCKRLSFNGFDLSWKVEMLMRIVEDEASSSRRMHSKRQTDCEIAIRIFAEIEIPSLEDVEFAARRKLIDRAIRRDQIFFLIADARAASCETKENAENFRKLIERVAKKNGIEKEK